MNAKSTYETFLRVKKHLETNLLTDLYLDSISEKTFVSKYHLVHLFSKYQTESPIQFVRRLRLERSSFYLRYSDQSVLEIAFNNGYETGESFSREFKKQFGYSPRSYRNSFHSVNIFHEIKYPAWLKKIDIISIKDPINYIPIKECNTYCEVPHPGELVSETIHNMQVIGVSYDDPFCTPLKFIRFRYALQVENKTKFTNTYTIKKGNFLALYFNASLPEIAELYEYAYNYLFVKENLKIRDLPAFERYFNVKQDRIKGALYIPVQ